MILPSKQPSYIYIYPSYKGADGIMCVALALLLQNMAQHPFQGTVSPGHVGHLECQPYRPLAWLVGDLSSRGFAFLMVLGQTARLSRSGETSLDRSACSASRQLTETWPAVSLSFIRNSLAWNKVYSFFKTLKVCYTLLTSTSCGSSRVQVKIWDTETHTHTAVFIGLLPKLPMIWETDIIICQNLYEIKIMEWKQKYLTILYNFI